MENDNENEEMKEYRNQLYVSRLYSEQQFDKLIVLLSTGGLSFSIMIANNLYSNQNIIIHSSFLLMFLWISFALSLILMLFSQISSRRSFDDLLNEKETECYALITKFLNWVSLILFLIGLIFLIIFASLNYVK